MSAEVAAALQAAVNARSGESNEEEFDALWECVELLSDITGVPLPEAE